MCFRASLLTALAIGLVAPAALAQTRSHPAVVELFTSQGCSSCPAADALLKTYAPRRDVIALSFAVDYWDHLGWKDTLASPKYTARQRAYAKSLGTGNVYTPQVVVNGAAQAVGSNKAEIEKAIFETRTEPAGAVIDVTRNQDAKRVTIDVGAALASGGAPSATVWLAVVAPRVDVEVKRGENRGRTLTYHNVVRELTPIGMWSGKPMKIELPASAVMEPGDRCAVLLQADGGGHILGSAWLAP
jgi:hypothetical protein